MEEDEKSSVASIGSVAAKSTTSAATTTTTARRKKKSRKRDKTEETESQRGDEREESEWEAYEEYVPWTMEPVAADGGVAAGGFTAKLQQLKDVMALLQPAQDKKKKKGKMEKQASERRASQEDASAQLELDKTRLIQELQDEIEQETFNTEQKIKLEERQMKLRRVQLAKTLRIASERRKAFMDHTLRCLEEEDWLRYMSCDGLPDPAALPELNAFLFLWSLEDDRASMKTLPRQCEVVIYLIRKLDETIQFSMKAAQRYIRDCKQIRQTFRDKLQRWVDMASYALLRQIDRDTIRVDLKNARYVEQLTPLVCCFWAFIRLPISMKVIAEKDKKPVEVDFEEVGLTIKMPVDLDCYCTAIRGLWFAYDHYSDLALTSAQPQVPEKLRMDMDLLEFCEREHRKLTELREAQREGRQQRLEEKRAMIERILNPPVEDKKKDKKGKKGKGKHHDEHEQHQHHKATPLPQMESPEEIVFREESEAMKETWKALSTLCSKKRKEINLRKYTMLGGLYRIDLIRQPPQPKDMRRDIFVTTLQLPKELEFVEFWRPYKAPPAAPENERTPEVIEAEMKALEAAMEKLALVTLKLPESVMWFEPPLVAHWLPDEGIWSTEDIHDIKYNEEKQTITFRTGRLGIHGLAGCRFINLPFQSWELKPEPAKTGGGGVLLTISGAIIQLEFLVREDLVCLHSVVGGAPALKALTHNFMTLNVLILTLREAGCDVFPDEDSIHHVKSVRKHPVVSRHLEACMGLLSTAYVFAWSRWNNQRGSREIAVQIKEIHGCIAKERSNAILLVTPFRAMIVNCSEVSSEYSGEPAAEHDEFYADVYHYALHNAGIKSRLAMKSVSYKLSTTVANLLQATNVINMSS